MCIYFQLLKLIFQLNFSYRAQDKGISPPLKLKIKFGKDKTEGEASSSCSASSSPLLNQVDESTKTPGLFLVGPAVRHGELSFCFV